LRQSEGFEFCIFLHALSAPEAMNLLPGQPDYKADSQSRDSSKYSGASDDTEKIPETPRKIPGIELASE